MLGVTAAMMLLLAAIMWRLARNPLFPPVMFAGIWGLTLLCIYLAGSHFLPISEYVCLIYLTGVVAFSLGGIIVLCAVPGGEPAACYIWRSEQSTRIALDILLIGLVVLFPYYLKVALQIAGTSNIVKAVPAIRMRMVETPNANLFGVAGNLNVLAGLVASALVLESDETWQRRARSILAIVLTLAYGALTGSKGGALFLLTLFFVSQVKAKTVKLGRAVIAVILVLMLFSVGIMTVNLAGSKFESAGTATGKLGEMIGGYWLDPAVAFSQVAERPDSLVSSASIDRFVMETAAKLGFPVEVPSLYSPYTPVSDDGENTNAYTIYFSYFKDHGWGGMILLVSGLSVVLTLFWRRAMEGDGISILIYASMCTATLLSPYTEEFFVGMEGFLKAYAVFWVLYRLLPRVIAPLWTVVWTQGPFVT